MKRTIRTQPYVLLSLFFLLLLLIARIIDAQLLLLPHFYQQHSNNKPALQVQSPILDHHRPVETDMSVSPLLNDIISINRDISIFSELTRSVDSIAARLEDPERNTTVLAPTDTVLVGLPRKPWEDEGDESEASTKGVEKDALYAGISGEDRASRNLKRFVGVHVVGVSPWEKGEENKVVTLEGKEVWWDEDRVAGVRRIYPDSVEVQEVKEAPNGQIWVLKGVIKY